VAEGANERGKVTCVPSRNTNADSFQNRGPIFSATKDIYNNNENDSISDDRGLSVLSSAVRTWGCRGSNPIRGMDKHMRVSLFLCRYKPCDRAITCSGRATKCPKIIHIVRNYF
jgi:hypothetical protein